jgi:hypothetical protein
MRKITLFSKFLSFPPPKEEERREKKRRRKRGYSLLSLLFPHKKKGEK